MNQRMEALRRANDVRTARAEFKKQMKMTAPAEAINQAIEQVTERPPDLRTMKTADFLKAIPRVGKFQANKLASAAQARGTTLGGLTARQQTELARQLEAMRQRRYGQPT